MRSVVSDKVSVVPASTTPWVADVLAGPLRSVRHLGSSSGGSWYEFAPSRVVVVQPPGAARLPCSLVTARPARLEGPVLAGGRALRSADVEVRVRRVVPAAVPALPPPGTAALQTLAALVGPADPDPALLGCGAGLTPFADDVLTGYLAAGRAWGLPVAALAAEVRARAPGRTTALSATLLDRAADGEVTPVVTALLRALSGGGDVSGAAAGLLAVGASSGRGLAGGVLAAAREAAR